MPDICFNCGTLSYFSINCFMPRPQSSIQSIGKRIAFGPWMKASSPTKPMAQPASSQTLHSGTNQSRGVSGGFIINFIKSNPRTSSSKSRGGLEQNHWLPSPSSVSPSSSEQNMKLACPITDYQHLLTSTETEKEMSPNKCSYEDFTAHVFKRATSSHVPPSFSPEGCTIIPSRSDLP